MRVRLQIVVSRLTDETLPELAVRRRVDHREEVAPDAVGGGLHEGDRRTRRENGRCSLGSTRTATG